MDTHEYSCLFTVKFDDSLGPIETENFSCVFVLFTVFKGIENNQLITWNNAKTWENLSVCTGPKLSLVKASVTKDSWL